MSKIVRSRFAPSPTGMLHLGGARTAIFAYLYAKHHHGNFLLRIEDTDRERSTQEAVDAIFEGLNWLGLESDEPPVFQTQRMSHYQQALQQLLNEGKAYRCYCSKERLDQLRDMQIAQHEKPRYDGHCRHLAAGDLAKPHVIRFKNPDTGEVSWKDQVLGNITIQNSELDDLIIARTDGMPTYNFSVVVDDIAMNITEVVRGNDHVNNTPRQINLFKAFGVKPPDYAHLSMILNEEGKKLSKRDNAANMVLYRDEGYLPEAVLNYLVRLGWSHGDQEIFSKDEMIACFDIQHVQKSAAKINPEKLLWLNHHYMMHLPLENILPALTEQFNKLGIDLSQGPALAEVYKAQVERCKTLKELAEKSGYFYANHIQYDEKALAKNFEQNTPELLQKIHARLKELTSWLPEPIHQVILTTAEDLNLKLGKVAQPIRIAVTGGTVSPPLDLTLYLIGRERVLNRLTQAPTITG